MSNTRVRNRSTPISVGSRKLGEFQILNSQGRWVRDTSRPVPSYASPYSWEMWQRTVDELHGRPPYRTGGPFRSITCRITPSPGSEPVGIGLYVTRDGKRRYAGGFSPVDVNRRFPVPGWLDPTASSSSKEALHPNMTDDAAQAWLGTRPKIQQVGLANAAFELGEIPSMLGTTARAMNNSFRAVGGVSRPDWRMLPQEAADNFLNHQFGWIPFLSDVRGALNTFRRSHEHIDRITSQNGRTVRRRAVIKNEVVESIVDQGSGGYHFPYTFPTEYLANPLVGPSHVVKDVTRKVVTGVGKYRFYIPHFDKSRPEYVSAINTARRYMDIFGVRVNPSNLYQAVPWSWALDWVSNAGEYIHRYSDEFEDNIAAEYTFTMSHTIKERVYTSVYPFHSGTLTIEYRLLRESKQRVKGSSPMGVSLSWENMNSRQWAIVGALGISRSK